MSRFAFHGENKLHGWGQTPTADNTIGSLCALSTSADAVVPGQVAEGARSNWELGQIKVFDGGADQDADTAGDNTLFMDEGIFVP